MRRALILAVALVATVGRSELLAWGCDGHQAIAMIAERLLDGAVAGRVRGVLAASPVNANLKRFCDRVPSDVIADVSTWADDFRDVEPKTAAWHFIDFPRAIESNTTDYETFCPNGDCVIDAIVAQFRVLTTAADARVKANALRFLIHFVADVHQPFHTITNGDRGGNCLPVTYFTQAPQESENGTFRPNLHGIWDSDSIRRLMMTRHLADGRALAQHVAGNSLPLTVAPLAPTTARVNSWARGSNALAHSVGYGRLRFNPPTEPESATFLTSCAENRHVGRRMAALQEKIGASYEQASVPVIISQMRLAGERLAAVLKAAFPNP